MTRTSIVRSATGAGRRRRANAIATGAALALALCCAGTGAAAAAQAPSTPAPPSAPAPAPGPPAASGTSLRLSLGEALERARAASAHLAELRSLAAAAGAGLTGARAERLPQIDASASYTRQSDVPELRLTLPGVGTETVFPNIPDNYRGHLGLAMPLYTGGRVANTVSANAEQLAAANQDLAQGRADLAQETATAYWGLVTARDSERVLAESLADYDAHLKETRDRRDVGMAASNEVLAVSVQREQAELARLQAAGSAAVANANLVRLLDLPPDTSIEPTEPLAAPPVAPPASPASPPPSAPAASPTAPAPATVPPAAPPATGPLTGAEPPETLTAAAFAARPEIVALRSRIAAGRASAESARAALRPQANLSAGYDYANPNPRILPLEARWKGSWSVGAIVSLSLFDGGRTAAAAAQIDAQADAQGHRLEDLERRIRLEVTQRLLELNNARQAAAVADRNLDSARENVRVARDRYHEGVIPSSELLDAETALLRAALDRTSALTQVRLALANLERAVGR
ncbi:MAG: TolC family protein [Acidobacteria bacterium]|nr:TolC family protein [Acidobacteriota bacterium]